MNNIALRDKYDQGTGASLVDASTNTVTTYITSINIDTRDCIGTESLKDAQLAYELSGGVGKVSGYVIDATNSNPIVLTLTPLTEVAKLKSKIAHEVNFIYIAKIIKA